MLFQTYVRIGAGYWRKWEPAPTNLEETRASILEAKEVIYKEPEMHVMGKRIITGPKYTHVCAIPAMWSFA
jgi:hypothetical protein